MATLEIPLSEDLAEAAHWSDDPPVNIEEEQFDILAFELWRLGSCPDLSQVEEPADGQHTVAERASCL